MSDDNITEHTKALFEAALATPGALGMAWKKAGPDEREEFVKANMVEVLHSCVVVLRREERPKDPALFLQPRNQRRGP